MQAKKSVHRKRSFEEAAASWTAIYREVQVTAFSRPTPKQHTEADKVIKEAVEHLEVREEIIRRTTVGGKYTFITREVRK